MQLPINMRAFYKNWQHLAATRQILLRLQTGALRMLRCRERANLCRADSGQTVAGGMEKGALEGVWASHHPVLSPGMRGEGFFLFEIALELPQAEALGRSLS